MHIASKWPAGLVSAFLTDESGGAPGHGFRADRTCSPRIRALEHGRAEVMKVGKRYRIRYRAWRTTRALGSIDRRAPDRRRCSDSVTSAAQSAKAGSRRGRVYAGWFPASRKRHGGDQASPPRIDVSRPFPVCVPSGSLVSQRNQGRNDPPVTARVGRVLGGSTGTLSASGMLRPSNRPGRGTSGVDPRRSRFSRPCVGRRRSNFSDGSRNI